MLVGYINTRTHNHTGDHIIMGYIVAFIFGIVVGTIGITGTAHLVDSGVAHIQRQAQALTHE